MLITDATPGLTSRAVEPLAEFSIAILPLPAMLKVWLVSTVTAVPEVTVIAPPESIRMLSAPEPVALPVVIGVVLVVVITTSAIAPFAAIRGAIATAVASRIRI